MGNDLSLDHLLDALAERVAAKLRPELGNGHNGSAGMKPRLLNLEQAGVYIGRSKEAVRHLINSGALPAVRADRCIFIDVHDLDAWIEQNKRMGLPS